MTVSEILEQAQALSPEERKELAKRLIDMIDTPTTDRKKGAEIEEEEEEEEEQRLDNWGEEE